MKRHKPANPPKRRGKPTRQGLEVESHRACALLATATFLLMSLIFAPIEWWPISFVCLVPWLVLIGVAIRAPRVYFYSYVLGLAFFLVNMRWMYPATGLGYVALSVYLAVYFPFIACPVRHVVRRRRWPLALVLPFVWVGSEMLRAVVISGFPWFYLSHSLYKVVTLIQVSDLVGAYGVSFVVAAVNGAVADIILAFVGSRDPSGSILSNRKLRFSIAYSLLLVIATFIYGKVQLDRDTVSPGPKIAVLQGDFVSTVFLDEIPSEQRVTEPEKMQTYLSMMRQAAKEKPDLYLLPESPWTMYLNPESRDMDALSRESFRRLREFATEQNATIVTGSASVVRTPFDLGTTFRAHNSATVFTPDGAEPGRYDKIHLVYFGETVPFRFSRLRFLYFWLNSIMPFSGRDGTYEYSLFRGDEFSTFALQPTSKPGRSYRFGIPICYEDVMPYVSREFVSGGSTKKSADLLLNISNDGWFGRGTQQPQHLAICVFRAVENRVGIARAVNTGVSGFIEPSGRVHDTITGERNTPWPGDADYAVANVNVDSRYTLYSRYGDWFGWLCALMWLAFFVDYWIVRARSSD